MAQQELRLVFAPKGVQEIDVIEVAQRLFVKHGIPPYGFAFDGVESKLEISKRMKRRAGPPLRSKGTASQLIPAAT